MCFFENTGNSIICLLYTSDGTASVRVLPCEESWYGVTYREDLDSVREAVVKMKAERIYREELWR